ncbi:MAG TPA: hypothetical protein VG206_23980 [Terriglobia bacterium]|nr:hypothetical protein [Terriglobia bacterium]
MNPESKRLTTADLARASGQSSAEPVVERGGVGLDGSAGDPLEPELVRSQVPAEEVFTSRRAQDAPADSTPSRPAASAAPEVTAPLFDRKEADDLRARWNDIQVGFVDEPRNAVENADSLVAETIKHLAESFAAGRQKLEGEWGGGGDASTETLRVTLQRYRSFFNRLLSI